MNDRVIGILAHVDAGKTTLSEAMMYLGGSLRKLGRVDHGDAFLDTDTQERERGITIFSKQAMLTVNDTRITLLDTPGHVDFSAEMERALQVLDCAILVIGGKEGVQGHTRTLWQLLHRYHVPTFLFVNKMDLSGADKAEILRELREKLDGGIVDFTADPDSRNENIAVCDEALLDRYLETGDVSADDIRALIESRRLFPCYFGAALKLDGVEAFLQGLVAHAPAPRYPDAFGAKVYKISRDSKGTRLSWMKITGGTLAAKTLLTKGEGDEAVSEKADTRNWQTLPYSISYTRVPLFPGTNYLTLHFTSRQSTPLTQSITLENPRRKTHFRLFQTLESQKQY